MRVLKTRDRAVRPTRELIRLDLNNEKAHTVTGTLQVRTTTGERRIPLILMGDPSVELQGAQWSVQGPGDSWESEQFGMEPGPVPEDLPMLLIGLLGDCTLTNEDYPHPYFEFFEFDNHGPYRRWVIEQSQSGMVTVQRIGTPWADPLVPDPVALVEAVAGREGSQVNLRGQRPPSFVVMPTSPAMH